MYTFIQNLKKKTPIDKQLYFDLLKNNNMSFEIFKESQINFYRAVLNFSKPLFVLCSRIDNYADRLKILENIFDEHGNGNLYKTHGYTYKKYLTSLGLDKKSISENFEHISTSNFFLKVNETVNNDKIDIAIAMYGIIEDRYTEISSFIAKTILKNKWLDEKSLVHYNMHEELDKYHAKLFYSIIEKKWTDKTSSKDIKKGLDLGNKLIFKLFNELLIGIKK